MWMKHSKLNDHEQKLVEMSSNEFDSYMMSNYTDMFKNRSFNEGQKLIHPMNFGFEIGCGWRHVLDGLCRKLKIISDLTGLVCVFDQIKEKWGGASFYYHVEKSEVYDVIVDSNDYDSLCETIDNLVSYYEKYCDYICDVLGTNILPEEKIVIGHWYYGCGIEGLKKTATDRWGKYAEEQIKLAERYLENKALKKELKESINDISGEEVCSIREIAMKCIESNKKGLVIDSILTFCENAAELGCHSDQDVDMWFRLLSYSEQKKVADKIFEIEERNYKMNRLDDGKEDSRGTVSDSKDKINYKDALAKAEAIDKDIRAGEHFNNVVYIEHLDKSKMEFWDANLIEDGEWVMIFTEHHGFFVYHKEDLDNYYSTLMHDASSTTLMHNIELDLDKDVFDGIVKIGLEAIRKDKDALFQYAANKIFQTIVETDGDILDELPNH